MAVAKSMGIQLNGSRVNRIITADSLKDAQYMGMFDRIKDWFRGGVKKEAIRRAWNVIGGDYRPEIRNKDNHAAALQDYAYVRLSTRREFCSNVNLRIESDWDTGKWSYDVRLHDSRGTVGELVVEDLDIGDGITLAGFMDYEELLGLNDLLSRYNPDADRSESLARLHEKLTNVNTQLLRSGKELWSNEAYSDKHELIIASLPEFGVDTAILDSILSAEPFHSPGVDDAGVFNSALRPERRIGDFECLIWPTDDEERRGRSHLKSTLGGEVRSEHCAGTQLMDQVSRELSAFNRTENGDCSLDMDNQMGLRRSAPEKPLR